MVKFGKKIGQDGAKSGQYLHPIYITSVWVHSVHVLKMNIAITTTKIIKKGKQKMRKMAVIWLVLSLVDVLALRLLQNEYLLAPMIWSNIKQFLISGIIIW